MARQHFICFTDRGGYNDFTRVAMRREGVSSMETIPLPDFRRNLDEYTRQQLAALDGARLFREQLKAQSIFTDSTKTLREVREKRANQMTSRMRSCR
jgi:hypothetical protein